MRQDTQNKMTKAKALVAEGMRVGKALQATGLGWNTWYKYEKPSPGKKRGRKSKIVSATPAFIDMKHEPEHVTVVVCAPHQLKAVMAGLQ
jgi:hypothetical protein